MTIVCASGIDVINKEHVMHGARSLRLPLRRQLVCYNPYNPISSVGCRTHSCCKQLNLLL